MSALDRGRADAVLEYWFAAATDDTAIGREHACYRRWFGGGPEVDAEVRARFADDLVAARAGACAAWESPRELLALIVLLDQVPRHVHRGEAEAFASDAAALAVTRRCLAAGLDEELALVERVFAYLPLQHSESLADHETAVVCFEDLARRARERGLAIASFLAAGLKSEHEHVALLRRFGRYPARNAALGRPNTPAEGEFLAH